METIEVDFDKKEELMQLPRQVKEHNLILGKDPFNLRVFVSHDASDTSRAAYLVFIANLLTSEIKGTNHTITAYVGSLNVDLIHLYANNLSFGKLQKTIEKTFKLYIKLEKKNPVDEIFGLWKDEKITLDQVRNKAWLRTK